MEAERENGDLIESGWGRGLLVAYARMPTASLMSIVLVSNEIKAILDWVTRESALCVAFC